MLDDGGMQLRHLETFLAIVDSGTLTAAATRLFKTQAAVSQDLRTLESGLGLVLIDRSGQRVRLTTAGEALVPMARRVLGELSDAQVEMARIRGGEHPTVRFACLPSLSSRACELIGEYAQHEPALRWSLITALRGAMIDGLRKRKFDLVICEYETDDDIVSVPLSREPLRVVLPANHPLAAVAVLKPHDLQGVPYIGLARGMGATMVAQRFFAAAGSYPTPTVEVNDTRLVLDLIIRFHGFGIVPVAALSSMSDSAKAAELVAIPTDPTLERQTSLSYLKGRTPPPSVRSFAEYLVDNWNSG
jgi:DNA-binding transcriptional LysR family regulator